MKRVLIIGAVLVLLLGIVVLWLSTEPFPGPGSETAGNGTQENPKPLAAGTTSRTEKANNVGKLEAPPPDKDSGFRPITPLGTSAGPAPAEVAASPEQNPGPVSQAGPESLVATAPSNAAPGGASSTENATTQSSVIPLAKKPAVQPETTTSAGRATDVNAEQPATQPSGVRKNEVEAHPRSPAPAVAPPPPSPTRGLKRSRTRQRPPAPPGRYETVMLATARSQPSDSAPIVDRIGRGTYLDVTGSEGDWLVVYSKRRNITVFVKRDEAMFTKDKSSAVTGVAQSDWPHVEETIRQAFARNHVTGVQVTFIGDTAYLKGTVKTDNERERAELFARSVLEVKHVFNGIRVE
jgi:hypothetical protein